MKFHDLGIKPIIEKIKIKNKLIIKIGDLAEKYRCSLGMVELELKRGILKEITVFENYGTAKLKALKNINKNLFYYNNKKSKS
jgi:hypothetical protein